MSPTIQHYCGCYWITSAPYSLDPPTRHSLPQVNIKAHATIFASASRTKLTQTFVNPSSSKGIRQIRYIFPLYDGVSVVAFLCRVGGRVITGEVQARDQARKTYEDAAAKGDTAGLLEQLPEASDVFTTTIGNIPPGATIQVELTYVGELKYDAAVDGVRYTIPTNIAPRYGALAGELHHSDIEHAQDGRFEVVVDAELPEGSLIREMRSSSHPVAVTIGRTSTTPNANPAMNRASATLSLGQATLDTDFVLQVVAEELETPKAVLETHPTIPHQRALMATLVPKFALKLERPEIVFVCDRSGSMLGSKIKKLVEALEIFLRSLPTGVKFNICSFGSSYKFLWEKSKTYSQSSLDEAVKHVGKFDADFGGTEMLQPIQETFKRRHKDMSLEVFLVTDGEIWMQEELFELINDEIRVKKAPIRIFTLGIGNDVSHALIEGVARAGNGFSQVVGDVERLDSKVVRMLKAGLTPHINNYTLDVKYPEGNDDYEMVENVTESLKVQDTLSDTDAPSTQASSQVISLYDKTANPDQPITNLSAGDKFSFVPTVPVPKVLQAPHQIPPLYPFSRTTVYLLLSGNAVRKTPSSVILRATSSQGPLELEIPVSTLSEPGTTIHQLAARKAVQELEEGRGWLHSAREDGTKLKEKHEGRFEAMVEREAVRLGVTFQIQGRWTSFVAVEKDQQDAPDDGKSSEKDFEFVDDGISSASDETPVVVEAEAARSFGHLVTSAAPKILGVRCGSGGHFSTLSVPESHPFATPVGNGPASPAPTYKVAGKGTYFGGSRRFTPAAMPPASTMGPASPMPSMRGAPGGAAGSSMAASATSSSFGFGSFGFGSLVRALAEPLFGRSSELHPATNNFDVEFCMPPIEDTIHSDPLIMGSGRRNKLKAKVPWQYNPHPTGYAHHASTNAIRAQPEDERKEDETAKPRNKLKEIIALQTFEGYWLYSSTLLEVLGLSKNECDAFVKTMDSMKTPNNAADQTLLATALAVRYLETRLSEEKEAWELIVEKAKEWAKSRLGPGDVENVFADVDRVLKV